MIYGAVVGKVVVVVEKMEEQGRGGEDGGPNRQKSKILAKMAVFNEYLIG